MIDFIMTVLSGWNPIQVAEVFFWLIAGIFLSALLFIWKDKSELISAYAPITLTTLGILGTFLGITIGLINFDFATQKSIDQSLPNLLGGLKMAFITSIAGLFASILTHGDLYLRRRPHIGLKMITEDYMIMDIRRILPKSRK